MRVTVGSIVLCGAEGLPLLLGCGASFVCPGEGHPWGWVCLPLARGCWLRDLWGLASTRVYDRRLGLFPLESVQHL